MLNENRVAIYSRTSRKDQFPENQLREMRAFASSRGWVVTREYVDSELDHSATSCALNALMVAVRKKQMDIVLVWRFNRLARSVKHLVAMLHEFQSLGIAFVSLGDAIDTTTSSGQVMLAMISAMARFGRRPSECRALDKSVRAGLQEKS